MKINVEFESFEEMIEFSEKLLGTKSKKEKTEKEAPEPKVEEPKAPTPEQKVEEPKAPAPEPASEPVKPETSYTLTDVRAALAALAKKDKEKMKAVLNSVGASNLKEVKEEDYATIMERCGDA